MDYITALITDKDDKKAHAETMRIAAESERSSEYYAFFDSFAALLSDSRSYNRTRGFILCCAQARWDTEGKLKQVLPDMLRLFHDIKPTVVRQCLKYARELILLRPELADRVKAEAESIELTIFKDSMLPLIIKDINSLTELPQ